jgi:hypothetical protein
MAPRARHTLTWEANVLGILRLVLDGEPAPYCATPRRPPHDTWGVWDSRPDPGTGTGRFVKGFANRRALEARVRAGGLLWP